MSESTDEASVPEKVQGLEKQLEYSGLFTHSIFSKFSDRINENEAFLFGLIDYLIAKNGLSTDELKGYVEQVKKEINAKGENLNPGVALRIENPDKIPPPPRVNCEERLHICKAVCCKLSFALSPPEVESGKIKWELGRPYFIRQEKSGYCSHINPENKCCSIYKERPGVCTNYSCENDKRIWKDFDNMELNEEWINENVLVKKPGIFSIKMNPKT